MVPRQAERPVLFDGAGGARRCGCSNDRRLLRPHSSDRRMLHVDGLVRGAIVAASMAGRVVSGAVPAGGLGQIALSDFGGFGFSDGARRGSRRRLPRERTFSMGIGDPLRPVGIRHGRRQRRGRKIEIPMPFHARHRCHDPRQLVHGRHGRHRYSPHPLCQCRSSEPPDRS